MKKLIIISSFIVFCSLFILFIYKGLIFNDRRPKIYMIVKVERKDFDFWNILKMGAQAAAKEYNCDFISVGPNDEGRAKDQIALVKNAIRNKPDAIILAAVDKYELSTVAKEVAGNNISLLTIDSDVDVTLRSSLISTDNVAASKDMGVKLATMLNNKGEIGIINFVSNSSTAIQREKGFKQAISNYKDMVIVSTKYCDGNVDKSYSLTKQLLQNYPNLKGIFGANQQSLEGINLAVRELGKQKQVIVVGFDSSISIIKGMEDDVIKAIAVQKPFNMGYISVKSAMEAIKGKKLESNIYIGYEIVTKDTIYEPKNEKLLFPFGE